MVKEKIETPSITIEAEKVVLNDVPLETPAKNEEKEAQTNSWSHWKTATLAAGVLVLGGAIAHKLLKSDN